MSTGTTDETAVEGSGPSPLPFAVFADELLAFFGRAGTATEATRLVEDLGLDSFDLLELDAMLTDLSGEPVPVALWATVRTMGDVHHWYEVYRSRGVL